MNKEKLFNASELMPVYKELLESGKTVRLTVSGYSMEPFLKDGRDSVLLKRCENIKKGDVVMYMRKNGRYILHRVVKTEGNNCFFTGDAQTFIEGPVDKSTAFAVVCEAYRKGKTLKKGSLIWEFFEHIWLWLLPIRGFLLKLIRITIYGKQSEKNEKS